MILSLTLQSPSEILTAVGHKARQRRLSQDLTQEGLANELNISRQAVVAMEADKYNCSVKLAKKIAKYFGCYIEDIFFDDDEEITVPKFREFKRD